MPATTYHLPYHLLFLRFRVGKERPYLPATLSQHTGCSALNGSGHALLHPQFPPTVAGRTGCRNTHLTSDWCLPQQGGKLVPSFKLVVGCLLKQEAMMISETLTALLGWALFQLLPVRFYTIFPPPALSLATSPATTHPHPTHTATALPGQVGSVDQTWTHPCLWLCGVSSVPCL